MSETKMTPGMQKAYDLLKNAENGLRYVQIESTNVQATGSLFDGSVYGKITRATMKNLMEAGLIETRRIQPRASNPATILAYVLKEQPDYPMTIEQIMSFFQKAGYEVETWQSPLSYHTQRRNTYIRINGTDYAIPAIMKATIEAYKGGDLARGNSFAAYMAQVTETTSPRSNTAVIYFRG